LIAHLKPSDFENLKIPLLKTEIQKQISQKIEQSHRLRKESKELLEQAKKIVEEEIEK
jgi:restriction endonuclease S subunit